MSIIPDLSAQGFTPYPSESTPVDGITLQIYRTVPDLPAAPQLQIPEEWEAVQALALDVGQRYYVTLRHPIGGVVVLPPVLPAIERLVCANPADPNKQFAGIELDSGGNVAWQNMHVEGYSQNLIAQNLTGNLTVNNVRTCRAWRRTPAEQYDGNGLYICKVKGKVVANGFFGRGNGWQAGKAAKEISVYRHDWYADFGVDGGIEIDNAIFAGAAGSLFEGRNHFVIRNSVFLNGATAVAAVMGGFELHDCTIYDGHYSASLGKDAGGQYFVNGWSAHVALVYYCDGILSNCYIVTRPNQGAAMAALAPAKAYPQGCVVGTKVWGGAGSEHPDYVAQATPPKLNATGCVIAGPWPGTKFAGDTPHSGAGFALKETTGKDFDPTPVLDAVEANQISIAAAVQSLTTSIRALVVP